MRKRVPIYLDQPLYDELVKRARKEYRDPRDQATLIVVSELRKTGLPEDSCFPVELEPPNAAAK
jgi:hypothetical protein